MKNKGFTLIELLAVIVILAIIALIATPIILGIINDAKKQADMRSAELYLKSAQLAIARANLTGALEASVCNVVAGGNLDCGGTTVVVDMDGNTATEGTIVFENGKITQVEGLAISNESFGYDNSGKLVKEELEYTDEACFTTTNVRVVSFSPILNDNDEPEICVQAVIAAGSQMGKTWNQDEALEACNGGEVSGVTVLDALSQPEYLSFFKNGLSGVLPPSVTTVEETMTGVRITGYTCDSKDIVIPKTIGGKKVEEIAFLAFRGKQLTSVVLPSGLKTIMNGAFSTNQFTTIKIPSSVTEIGTGAFFINQLTSVTIPNGVTSIGGDAFGCNQLTSVTIGNGVTSIEELAFELNQLTSVTIPNSVISIGRMAFAYNQLTSVRIGSGVTSIGFNAFDSSSSATQVCNGVTYYENPNLSSITIDNKEGAIEGAKWGAGNATITYLR